MKFLLSGGGTAGHVTPAIAIAKELKKQYPNSEILFIGRDGGGENNAVIKSGIKIETIKIQGLVRKLSIKNVEIILNAFKAKNEAERILQNFKPDVILGTGGYVCWPVLTAGRSMGIPILLHESNITPGLTTRLLSHKCDKVLLGKSETSHYFGSKVKAKTVGNPIDPSFYSLKKDTCRRKLKIKDEELFILSFGGSGGAEKINKVIEEFIINYSTKHKDIRHIHATGNKYYDEKYKKCINNESGCDIIPYIDKMATYLTAADIVICRSGAMTIAEISATETVPILIPSPNVSSNHQYLNAKHLSDHSAAILIEEKNLTTEVLIDVVNRLKNDKNGRKTRAKNIKSYATPDAAKAIVSELVEYANSGKITIN